MPGDADVRALAVITHRRTASDRDARDPGQRRDAFDDRIPQCTDRLTRGAARRQSDAGSQHAVRPIPNLRVEQVTQRTDHEAGRHQQHDSERDLRHYERATNR
jgi:hypothetical protein